MTVGIVATVTVVDFHVLRTMAVRILLTTYFLSQINSSHSEKKRFQSLAKVKLADTVDPNKYLVWRIMVGECAAVCSFLIVSIVT